MLRRLILPVVSLAFFLAVAVSIALIVGEEQERQAWVSASSTLDLYTTEDVCVDQASNNVLNCGHCGPCSNRHDLSIYHETRATLTQTMTDCARNDLLFGKSAYECLKDAAGMTDGCTKCWVLNYHCNIQNCVKTCVKQRFFPFLPSYQDWESHPLDPCIACDERLCGPVFVGCAGANRRRVGVVSDIERDHQREICDKVDWEWALSYQKGTPETLTTLTISPGTSQEEPETSTQTTTADETETEVKLAVTSPEL